MTDMNFVQKSKKDVWQTPDTLWQPIDNRDNIDLDPCAAKDTNIGDTSYTIEDNGLAQPWSGTVWLNPPFSYKNKWFNKLEQEASNCDRIYVITPDSTNVQSWWHNKLAPMCDWAWFSNGRVKYIDPQTGEKGKSPSFGTAINIHGDLPENVKHWLQNNGDLLKRV
jgi:DNA N-6-adenine-methyltransferase (Dam).